MEHQKLHRRGSTLLLKWISEVQRRGQWAVTPYIDTTLVRVQSDPPNYGLQTHIACSCARHDAVLFQVS